MRKEKISSAVIRRLPRYYRHLNDLYRAGTVRISSSALAKSMSLTASQIRQDLSCFRLTAAFDINPALVGAHVAGVPVYHMDDLEAFLRDSPASVGALTVPGRVALDSARRLCACGVSGIWNFTNVELPAQELPGVKVENVHFADSLLTLSYMISEGHI